MSNTRFLNADLDLESARDLDPLARELAAAGLLVLHCERHDDGIFRARFEASLCAGSCEAALGALARSVEGLGADGMAAWRACLRREFDLGYECGDGPQRLEETVSAATLARIAALGGALRATIYPCTEQQAPR